MVPYRVSTAGLLRDHHVSDHTSAGRQRKVGSRKMAAGLLSASLLQVPMAPLRNPHRRGLATVESSRGGPPLQRRARRVAECRPNCAVSDRRASPCKSLPCPRPIPAHTYREWFRSKNHKLARPISHDQHAAAENEPAPTERTSGRRVLSLGHGYSKEQLCRAP
jgi:hypothetical protein